MDSDEFFVWLFVEQYKKKHPKASDDEACRRLAEDGGVSYVKHNKEGDLVPIAHHKSHRGLARLYSEAKRMRAEDQALADAWDWQLAALKSTE